MALSLTAASTRSFNLDRPISFPRSNKLSSLTSLQLPLLRRLPTENRRRFLAPPQRQIIFRVEAKKQTFSTFDELLESSDKPVFVDFYATWCGPCQYMAPILNEVGETLKDKIQVVKVDTEKYPSIADRYRIQALPTFIVFKDGKPCDRFEGALPADQLIQRIENALKVTQ